MILLLLTTITEPGIIPRNSITDGNEECQNGETKEKYVALYNGETIPVNKCTKCQIYKPPRSFHCGECEACIEVFDHHCSWIGNCIGKRNRHYLLCFFTTISLHCCITGLINIIFLYQSSKTDETEESYRLAKSLLSIILLIVVVVSLPFLGFLTIKHCYLLCNGFTLFEYSNRIFKKSENKYDKGCFKNCTSIWIKSVSRVFCQGDYDPEDYLE